MPGVVRIPRTVGFATRATRVVTVAVITALAACVLTVTSQLTTLGATSRAAHIGTSPSAATGVSAKQLREGTRASSGCPAPFRAALAHAHLRGYALAYCTTFAGTALPPGWDAFSGVPGGDPAGRFVPSHVNVHDGMLTLTASRDPKLHGRFGTGGVCQCGAPRRFGAFFVRSRVTGAGPDEIDLLWPVAHVWPPEVDFNESNARDTSTTWSVHYGRTNHVTNGSRKLNLEAWHTWGVVWTPTSVRLLVDGKTWGAVTARREIPSLPMTLDISQQTSCGLTSECPKATVQMQVAWVAEYAAT
jgi:Glycosyl hydrolases family 16